MDVCQNDSSNNEPDFVSMQDLSNTIDEIVPDIYVFFEPHSVYGIYNNNVISNTIKNNISHEIEHNNIEFLRTKNSSKEMYLPSCSDDDVCMTNEDCSNINQYENIKLSPDSKVNMERVKNISLLNKNNTRKVQSKIPHNSECEGNQFGSIFDNLLKCESKLIKKCQKTYSSLIQRYCFNCKTVFTNYFEGVCQDCQTVLLFECVQCNCRYKSLINIQNHLKYECEKRLIFQCAECNYKTFSKFILAKHIHSKHSILMSPKTFYKCSICSKNFKSEYNKLSHERVCAMEPIFQCKDCSFKTKFHQGLSIHIQVKHKKLNSQKIHKCPDCDKKYTNFKSLKAHVKNGCGKKFEFKCDHCNFTINRKFSLAKHIHQNHTQLFFKNNFLCRL